MKADVIGAERSWDLKRIRIDLFPIKVPFFLTS